MTTANSAQAQDQAFAQSPDSDAPLPLRGDTFLGVCEAIGTDLGFHPNFLRIPLAALILWDPKMVIGAYLGLGLVVALARWLYPVGRDAPAATAQAEATAGVAPAQAADSQGSEQLLAA